MTHRILITGITGQTGSYLADILIRQGHEVHGVVRRASTFNRSRIEHLRKDPGIYGSTLFLHYADLSDATAIRRLIKKIGPHEIYHLAGQSHVGLSFEIPESTAHEIAMATLSILEIIRDLDDPPRLFHASSSEVFGNAEIYPQKESTPFRPVSPYGCAKAFATQISQVYRDAYGLFICNGILYNHESPRRAESFVTRKISKAAAAAALGSLEVLKLGNLDAERDWGFAYEYAELIIRMLRHHEPGDYIVSTGVLTTVRDFAISAYRSLGLNILFSGDGSNETGIDVNTGRALISIDECFYRPLDSRRLVGDSSKAQDTLNWRPKTYGSDLAMLMAKADMAETLNA